MIRSSKSQVQPLSFRKRQSLRVLNGVDCLRRRRLRCFLVLLGIVPIGFVGFVPIGIVPIGDGYDLKLKGSIQRFDSLELDSGRSKNLLSGLRAQTVASLLAPGTERICFLLHRTYLDVPKRGILRL